MENQNNCENCPNCPKQDGCESENCLNPKENCENCPHRESGGCPNCPFSKFMNEGSHTLEELNQFKEKIQKKLAMIEEEIEKVTQRGN
ncbi:MAG: hypothetical protein ABIG87_00260 [Patescibacteria group bacterium]